MPRSAEEKMQKKKIVNELGKSRLNFMSIQRKNQGQSLIHCHIHLKKKLKIIISHAADNHCKYIKDISSRNQSNIEFDTNQ